MIFDNLIANPRGTGIRVLGAQDLQIINLGLRTTGCGVIGSVLDTIVSFVSSVLQSAIGNFIVRLKWCSIRLNGTKTSYRNSMPPTP